MTERTAQDRLTALRLWLTIQEGPAIPDAQQERIHTMAREIAQAAYLEGLQTGIAAARRRIRDAAIDNPPDT